MVLCRFGGSGAACKNGGAIRKLHLLTACLGSLSSLHVTRTNFSYDARQSQLRIVSKKINCAWLNTAWSYYLLRSVFFQNSYTPVGLQNSSSLKSAQIKRHFYFVLNIIDIEPPIDVHHIFTDPQHTCAICRQGQRCILMAPTYNVLVQTMHKSCETSRRSFQALPRPIHNKWEPRQLLQRV